MAKSQAVPHNTIHARAQQASKRAAAAVSSAGGAGGVAGGGLAPVLPLVASAIAGGLPSAGRCGLRPGPSRAGAHDPRARGGPLPLMARLAPWLAIALIGLVLLGAAAPGAEGGADGGVPRPVPYDVALTLGPFFFNPSVVRHRGVYLATARTAHMKRIEKTNWWGGRGGGASGA